VAQRFSAAVRALIRMSDFASASRRGNRLQELALPHFPKSGKTGAAWVVLVRTRNQGWGTRRSFQLKAHKQSHFSDRNTAAAARTMLGGPRPHSNSQSLG
jgi:hypothetical protein